MRKGGSAKLRSLFWVMQIDQMGWCAEGFLGFQSPGVGVLFRAATARESYGYKERRGVRPRDVLVTYKQ